MEIFRLDGKQAPSIPSLRVFRCHLRDAENALHLLQGQVTHSLCRWDLLRFLLHFFKLVYQIIYLVLRDVAIVLKPFQCRLDQRDDCTANWIPGRHSDDNVLLWVGVNQSGDWKMQEGKAEGELWAWGKKGMVGEKPK